MEWELLWLGMRMRLTSMRIYDATRYSFHPVSAAQTWPESALFSKASIEVFFSLDWNSVSLPNLAYHETRCFPLHYMSKSFSHQFPTISSVRTSIYTLMRPEEMQATQMLNNTLGL